MDDLVRDVRPAARWSTRTGAWLIDLVLVGGVIAVLGDLLGLGPGLGSLGDPFDVAGGGALLFVYWTLFEANEGQSPGKLVLDIQVVGEDGTTPSLPAAAIQSFGKAFLLPLDVLVGVAAMPDQGLRLFNRLSGTRVVEVSEPRQRGRGPTPVDA